MTRHYRNIGRETLEMSEIAPLGLLRQIIELHEDDNEQKKAFEWPVFENEDDNRRAIKAPPIIVV